MSVRRARGCTSGSRTSTRCDTISRAWRTIWRLVDDEVVATRPALRDVLENTRCALAFARGDVEAYDVAFRSWQDAALAHDDASALLAHYKGGLFFAIFGMHDRARAVFDAGLALARERRDVMAEGATLAMSAFAYLATGDLAAVRDAVRAAQRLPMSKLAALHAASWGTVAALHLGDEALLADCMNVEGIELYAQTVYAPGFAEALARRGADAEARALLGAAIRKIENPRGLHLTMLAVARRGDERDFTLARAILATAAVATRPVVEQPSLALFDAYVARRSGSVERARKLATLGGGGILRARVPAARSRSAGGRGAYRRSTRGVPAARRGRRRRAARGGAAPRWRLRRHFRSARPKSRARSRPGSRIATSRCASPSARRPWRSTSRRRFASSA